MLAGQPDVFKVGEGVESQTKFVNIKVVHYNNNPSNIKLRLIDTPGLADENNDHEYLQKIVDEIKKLKKIDLFIICLEGKFII